MVFNSLMLLSVAKVSAGVWQEIGCFPERISNDQLLDLFCFFPLQQIGSLAFCLWTFFCLPPSADSSSSSSSNYSDSSSSGGPYYFYADDDDVDDDDHGYHNYSHSD
ncbi:uncharacterized protein LOC124925255 [Impatiens glandulifera]|uniref:uncharacterized protein LOC124925255 n=1 Tax=Impatiens glandulifera TaxID=253017 RepID=UPI001FB0A1F8|nr:uncharacterized protein LOC124925255 [Impatiens glandulifera]